MDAFEFYSPLWFALAPLVIAGVWYAHAFRRRPAALFSSLADLKNLPVTTAQRVRRVLPFVYALGLLLLVTGLARPRAGKSESRINTEGIAIELVLDLSGSMEARDFTIDGKAASRVAVVRNVVKQFVLGSKAAKLPGRHDDLVGLVAFATYADSKCPLTLDHGALTDIAQTLDIPKPIFDRQGNVLNMKTLQEDLNTAIGDGTSLAVDRLRGTKAKSKVIILLTDGDNNAGVVDPREAAKIAKAEGIKIYAIGIGHDGPVPFPMMDAFGQTVLQDRVFPIDEALLKEMAQTTGGKYFHAEDTEGLLKVYSEIDKMEKSKVEESRYTDFTELYAWLIVPGLALIVGVSFLMATRFRALP
ncbi:MAG TPA: VWA domain-containing protein [Planctomycetota bacterium]|jgi:Ca-activated chloride channel family protein